MRASSEAPPVDGYLLFAPLFGATAPTTRQDSPEELAGRIGLDEPFSYFRLKRFYGVLMMHLIGVKQFDGAEIFLFNNPGVDPAYSFRAVLSMAPDDHAASLAAIDAPLLVIVGGEDELFLPEAFEPIVTANSAGEVLVLEGASHNSVHHDPRAVAAAAAWLAGD